jgi:hypothetical protein
MNKKDIKILLSDLDIIEKEDIHKSDITAQNQDDTYTSKDNYSYRFVDSELTSEDIKTALLAKQTKDIQTIKKMVLFFVILTILSMSVGLWYGFKLLELL